MKREVVQMKEKAITLIALVITIVILLILAGVSINYILGKNNIFAEVKRASLETKIARSRRNSKFNLSK